MQAGAFCFPKLRMLRMPLFFQRKKFMSETPATNCISPAVAIPQATDAENMTPVYKNVWTCLAVFGPDIDTITGSVENG